MSFADDVRVVLSAFGSLTSVERVHMMETQPALYHALARLRNEEGARHARDLKKHTRDMIRLKVETLRAEGRHVPAWMIHESSIRV